MKIVLCQFQAFHTPLTWHPLVSTFNGCIVTESKRSNFQFHFSKYLLSLSFQVFLDNNQLFLSTLRSYEVVSCLLAEDFFSFPSKWFRQHSISAVVEEKAANFAWERTYRLRWRGGNARPLGTHFSPTLDLSNGASTRTSNLKLGSAPFQSTLNSLQLWLSRRQTDSCIYRRCSIHARVWLERWIRGWIIQALLLPEYNSKNFILSFSPIGKLFLSARSRQQHPRNHVNCVGVEDVS